MSDADKVILNGKRDTGEFWSDYDQWERGVIKGFSDVANSKNLDVELNMPDFIIGAYLYESLKAMASANKANGEYFKVSAQKEESSSGQK